MRIKSLIMKSISVFILITFLGIIVSCNTVESQSKTQDIPAIEFSNKIKQNPDAQIIDVRTPGEYANGHIKNSKNIDINSSDFQNQISALDKNKPVYVYCLSGARSSSASRSMINTGFKEVYNLSGGMIKWRASNLPETKETGAQVSASMTKDAYYKMLETDKLVLVDFYADWCAPCKKMKPYLEEISTEMKDNVIVVRINADNSKELTQELTVEALPTLILYKKGTQVWRNAGYLTKEEIVKQLQ